MHRGDPRDLVHEARLADTRLADDPDHLALAARYGRHAIVHEPELPVATDEPAEWATAQSKFGGFASHQTTKRHAADPTPRRRRELEPPLEERCRRLAHDDGVDLAAIHQRLHRRARHALALELDRPRPVS